MTKRPLKPLSLNDMTSIRGLPPGDAYGADHAPTFDQGETNRLYLEARAALEQTAVAQDCLQALTILAGVEHATALDEPPQPVDTASVELAQALMLRGPFDGTPVEPDDANALIATLSTEMALFLDQTAKPSVDEKGSLLSRRRIQTLRVRHTFYPHHASIAFDRIGDELETVGHAVLGVSLAQAAKISRAAAYWVASMLKTSGLHDDLPRWLRGEIPFDPAWSDLFEIRPDLMAIAMADIPVATIAAIVDRLSMAPGDLANANPDHLHLDNPVWRRPFVKFHDRYYCFSPGTAFASQLDIQRELADATSTRAGELLGEARGVALEAMTRDALAVMFPHAEIYGPVFWTDKAGQDFETDILVLIDGIALIFECKAGALSAVGRRGSMSWLRDFDDIVVEASLQAWRFETELRDRSGPLIELRTDKGPIMIAKADLRHVVRFGVSLERVTMASFGFESHLLTRIRDGGGEPMPIFTIGDLWQVRDLVGSEGRCLHYLLRRAEIEGDHDFLGDELDLIAEYLRTGFVTLWAGTEGPSSFYGMSDFLRHHQKGTPHYRPDVALPRRTTAWWDRLIRDAETNRPKSWTDMIYDLLNVPVVSQERYEEDVRGLRRMVRRMRGKGRYEGTMMQAPNQRRPSLFACLATSHMTANERAGRIRHLIAKLADEHPDERQLIFALDADTAVTVPRLTAYRAVGWEHVSGPIEATGDEVGSGLIVDIRPKPDAVADD